MENVSRPLIALLVASVAFLAVWMVALKPSSSGNGSNGANYQSAIAKAHQAVATSAASSIEHGGTVANPPTSSTPAPTTTAPAATAPAVAARPSAVPAGAHAASRSAAVARPTTVHAQARTATQRLSLVTDALRRNKVVALLFYNGAAADDRAIKHELASVPENGRRVVKLAVPLSELAQYTAVTDQVPVNVSPTLVLIDGQHQASTIVGFADRFEIAQRVTDALTIR